MDFLKDVLGEDFSSFSEKIESFNNAHPESRIKLCNLSEGNYVSRGKYREKEAELVRLKEELDALKSEDGASKLSEELALLNEKYEKDTGDLRAQIEKVKFDGAVDLALFQSGARSVKAVRALLNLDDVVLTDEGLEGLIPQLDALKQESGFLFRSGTSSTGLKQGSVSYASDGFVASAREAAGLK